MINGLKAKNRDVELVVDVLKQELKNKEMEEDDINDLIVKKVCGPFPPSLFPLCPILP
jgi:hypothetical protein